MFDGWKWKYEYEALKAQITDPRMIENARKIVEVAIETSRVSAISFDECFQSILYAAIRLKGVEDGKKK